MYGECLETNQPLIDPECQSWYIPNGAEQMKKFMGIVFWFAFFTGLHGTVIWFLPNEYRVHPRLAKPIVISPFSKQPINDSPICIVGDSMAHLAPWPYRKITEPGTYLEDNVHMVRLAPRVHTETFVILAGQTNIARGDSPKKIERQMARLLKTIQQKYPEATVYAIPPFEVHEIALNPKYGDGWHLFQAGYDELAARHPVLKYPTLKGDIF